MSANPNSPLPSTIIDNATFDRAMGWFVRLVALALAAIGLAFVGVASAPGLLIVGVPLLVVGVVACVRSW